MTRRKRTQTLFEREVGGGTEEQRELFRMALKREKVGGIESHGGNVAVTVAPPTPSSPMDKKAVSVSRQRLIEIMKLVPWNSMGVKPNAKSHCENESCGKEGSGEVLWFGDFDECFVWQFCDSCLKNLDVESLVMNDLEFDDRLCLDVQALLASARGESTKLERLRLLTARHEVELTWDQFARVSPAMAWNHNAHLREERVRCEVPGCSRRDCYEIVVAYTLSNPTRRYDREGRKRQALVRSNDDGCWFVCREHWVNGAFFEAIPEPLKFARVGLDVNELLLFNTEEKLRSLLQQQEQEQAFTNNGL